MGLSPNFLWVVFLGFTDHGACYGSQDLICLKICARRNINPLMKQPISISNRSFLVKIHSLVLSFGVAGFSGAKRITQSVIVLRSYMIFHFSIFWYFSLFLTLKKQKVQCIVLPICFKSRVLTSSITVSLCYFKFN